MRKSTFALALGAFAAFGLGASQASADLIITGVFDGPLPGGDPKGVELTATANIADLSIYGLETVSNGGASSGVEEATLPAVSLNAGDNFYVVNGDGTDFLQWFGFAADVVSAAGGAVNHNGDDVIILYEGGSVHDQFGVTGVDGTGEAWETLDGWAYRNNGVAANGGAFNAADWSYSGPNEWDGDDGALDDGTNASATPPMPVGTYVPEPASLALIGLGGLAIIRR